MTTTAEGTQLVNQTLSLHEYAEGQSSQLPAGAKEISCVVQIASVALRCE